MRAAPPCAKVPTPGRHWTTAYSRSVTGLAGVVLAVAVAPLFAYATPPTAGGQDGFEAESAGLSVGLVAASNHPAYAGSDLAGYPPTTASNAKAQCQIESVGSGDADIDAWYLSGGDVNRGLELATKGKLVQTAASDVSAAKAVVASRHAETRKEGKPESTLPRAEGRIPNQSYPSNELFSKISPQLSDRHHNQPTVINGYLLLAGNGVHEFWDISDPYSPELVSAFLSPHRSGEAESHQVSYARFPDGSLHLATISGRGIDLWDIDDVRAPRLLSALELPNIDYGDVHNAVWGVAWHGDYIYVGATTSGLYVVDAGDPTRPRMVTGLPVDELGGVTAGPVFALGNLLVITTPRDSAGVATLDIGEPGNPALLDFVRSSAESYIGGFYGKNAHLQGPFRTYDVTTDPGDIQLVGSATTPTSEYMSFGEGHLFLGGVRGGSQGIWKYDIGDPNDLRLIGRIRGRDRRWDDQFSVRIGNLVAVSDDQNVNGYVGSYLAVHATEPDVRPPEVEYVNPPDGAVDQAQSSRIGLSFSDQIEFTSVDGSTLVVRPVGGPALTGKWGHSQTVVTFSPDQPLEADTRYEVVAVAGGITDVVGNALAADFRSEFRTGTGPAPVRGGIEALTAVETGQRAEFVAKATPATREYRWDFGDGEQAGGASVSHSYDAPGRYTVTLSAIQPEVLEAETATLSGGVVAASNNGGYSGSGYADYPAATGANVKVRWRIERDIVGDVDIGVRYANGGGADRPLELVVNGDTVRTVAFEPTGSWRDWRTVTIAHVTLQAGRNTVELVARNSAGPNVDKLSAPSSTSAVVAYYSATQIVHRPLTANAPARSSTVIVTADGARAWAVNPDADTVTAVDTGTREKAFESSVGRIPRTLAQAPDGTIWVVNEGSYDISVLDSSNGAVIGSVDLPYASMPYGIAFAPDGGAAYVTLQAIGRLLRIDPATRTVVHSLALGSETGGMVPQPRGIAIDSDSSRVLVTRFVSPDDGGQIYDVEARGQTLSLNRAIALAIDPGPDTAHGGRGLPNYVSSLAISPDGVHARVPSKKDNIQRGVARDGQALTHESAVRTVVSQIDLSSTREDLGARIDLDGRDMASAVAFSARGDLLFAAIQGSNTVDVIDAYGGTEVAGMPTGFAPQGLTLDDQGRLYVQNFLSRSLSIFDVDALLRGTESTAELLAEIDLVADETLSDEVLRGKQLFYDASSSKMSLEGYISCASCHLDGGQDGRTWDFTDRGEGLRNTTSLQGRGGTLRQGPVHWTGNFDEIQDVENDIRAHFGGSGFMSDEDFDDGTRSEPLGDPKAGLSTELDALAAYVSSLTGVPRSPYRNADGTLTADAERGKQVFAVEGCGDWHSGGHFTDSAVGVLHDVGTIGPSSGERLGQSLTGFDTPTLAGVWATAPYLHDGSASTLAEAIDAHSDVSVADSALSALVSYVRQIDEPSADATLSALALSDIDIGVFDPATTVYAADVGGDVATTTATATPADALARVAIADAEGSTSGTMRDVTLGHVENAVRVTVTAADGQATETYTVTVTRASTLPAATVAAAAGPVAEGADASFTVRLDKAAQDALTVPVLVSGSGALSATRSYVAIPAGESTAALSVRTGDDSVVGPDRVVRATVAAGTGYLVGSPSSAEMAVEEDDAATFTVAATPEQIDEGRQSTLTVEIDNGVTFAAEQTIVLALSGTAGDSDYELSATGLTLASGTEAATATVAALVDDEDEEPEETIVVAAHHEGVGVGTAMVSITASDAPPTDGATLDSLRLSDVHIGDFHPGATNYAGAVAGTVRQTTVTATPTVSEAEVTIADGDGTVVGTSRTASLVEGTTDIGVTVVSADRTATRTYTVAVTRVAESWGERVPDRDIDLSAADRPRGLWSDGDTLWAADWGTGDALAYALADGGRLESRDLAFGPALLTAIFSDGDTIWVADWDGAVKAYRLADGQRLAARDLDAAQMAEAGNARPSGLWSDGATIWVADYSDARAYAYGLVDGVRQPDKELPLRADAATVQLGPFGLWSDGTTLLATDWMSGTVRGYALADGVRRAANDIDANASANGYASGLWSDGETLWVVDEFERKAYAYLAPGSRGSGDEDEDDNLVEVSIVADGSPVSEGTAAAFTLTRSGAVADALTVAVSVAESGAVLAAEVPAAVTFGAGESTAALSLATVDDAVAESTSTVTAAITDSRGYTAAAHAAAAQVSVEDNDAAAFAVSVNPSEITEGEVATLTVEIGNGVTFAEDQVIALDFSGSTATKDTDYTVSPESLKLPAASPTVAATVTAMDDRDPEGAETVTVAALHGGATVSTATLTIAASDGPLTARFLEMPARHDGSTWFSFELRFSEEFRISYRTLEDEAFQMTAGSVRGARRLAPPLSRRWEITVRPESEADVVVVLPATADCDSAGAICTPDGRPLSHRLEATVRGSALPDIAIRAGSALVAEGTAAAFTLTRSSGTAEALTVAVIVTESGVMLAPAPPTSVTFAAGESNAALSVATADDAVVEGGSVVTAALAVGDGYTVAADGGSAEVVVEDDDAASFAVGLSPASVAEGSAATLTVSVANGVTFAQPQVIGVAASGSATAADYALLVDGAALSVPYELTLAAGAAETAATLSATDDAVTEAEETVTLTASHGGVEIGSATTAIQANDALAADATLSVLSLSGIDIGAFDPATTAYAATAAESVARTTVTATPSDEGASVVIADADGSTAGTTREVALGYGENAITATVTAADGATTATYTVTVTRAYTPPVATVEAGSSPVAEGAEASFTVRLDKPARDALTVAVSVSETGDALSGTASSVGIAAGETEAALRLGTTNDSVVEADSTVTVALAAGDGYAVGAANSAAVSVEDDDAATFAATAADATIEEGAGTTLTVAVVNGVTFAADQAIALTASGTAAAADYALDPAALTLAAGGSSVSATLTATDDEAEEQDETVAVSAVHSGSTVGTVTVTIAANDAALSDDATLSALSLSGIDIGVFDPATTAYAAAAAESVARTTVTATPSDEGASVVIADADGSTSGTAREVALGYGENAIAATVTAADGSTTAAYTVTVTRARPPLTGRVDDVPDRHDGSSEEEFDLVFSEQVEGLSYKTLRAGFNVDGGTLLRAKRKEPPGNVLWRIAVRPAGDGEVVATLPGNRSCQDNGAVCAPGGRMLSNSPTARIPGPATVVSIVADGSPVSEGSAAAFTLTRTGDAADALTVAVSVSESGSMAASAPPGEATFAAGEATTALTVGTTDDAVVEGGSVVTAALAVGDGYTVAADGGSAEVVVEDDDAASFAVGLSPASVAEGSAATLTVAVANGVTFAQPQAIGVAASGSATAADYALLVDGAPLSAPYELTLAAGAAETAATLSATDDAVTEAEETVTLTASHGGVEIGGATTAIQANDALAADATLSVLSLSGIDIGAFDPATTAYAATAAESVAQTTVTATPSDEGASVVIADADGSTAGTTREAALGYGENAITATVTAADGATTATYTVTVTIAANDAALSDDATLGALALSGIDIGAFDPATTAYAAAAAESVARTTVTATPSDAGADVTITDARGSTAGTTRTTELVEGANEVGVDVTAEDGVATRSYAVTVTRAAAASAAWGERMADRDIDLSAAERPLGLWSDGETLWVADWYGEALAYVLEDGARLPGKDFALGAYLVSALASDGETVWAADFEGGVYAYRLSNGERLADSDLDGAVLAAAGNDRPTGLWSDGETIWVADYDDRRVYAYRLSNGVRQPDAEFSLVADDLESMRPFGLWSDGATLLVSNWSRGTVAGYALAGGARQAARDIGVDASANDDAAGLWSDGETLWVVDDFERKAYAYTAPGLKKPRSSGQSPLGNLASRATVVPGGAATGTPVWIPDTALRGRIAVALGKSDNETIGAGELAALVVLDARGAGVAELTGLEYAVNLEGLDLGRNAVEDLAPLAGLGSLRRLSLDGALGDSSQLAALGELTALSLRDNGLEELSVLSSLTGLVVLDVADNRIEDLGPLWGLVRLRALDIANNRIEDVSPLAGLVTLRELAVHGNRIADFSALSTHEALRIDGTLEQRENH